ncbi:MAG TPA: methyltransferase domain-containing protein [Solirubrobacterales bacterium]|nr:methyltransferase domain-containing protein [Solirubrobacterales bacterium]
MSATATSTDVICPLCGWSAPEFLPQGRVPRPNARCGGCGCLERHRAMYLYLRDETSIFDRPTRLLHFAPEAALRPVIEDAPLVEYISTDLEMDDVTIKMDIGDLLFKDDVFDCVICSHVLEHIPDDRNAMREIRRVLRPDGIAVILVPILSTPDGRTYEDPSIVTPEERERVFGQDDHVRIYGQDFPDRLAESGFEVQEVNPGRDMDSAVVSRFGLLPNERIFVCRPGDDRPDDPPASPEPAARPDPAVGFVTRVSPGDTMMRPERLDHYFGVGLGALRLIEDALEALGADDPRRILDLPSGHGRVLRMLRSRFPDAEITACDVDAEGIEFCAAELGAEPRLAPEAPGELSLGSAYDLIWCGSLVTHLPAAHCVGLLGALADHLAPRGVLIFTSHGDTIEELLSKGRMRAAVGDGKLPGLLDAYRTEGFAFAPYESSSTGEYGVTLAARAWLEARIDDIPGLRMVSHAASAWDGRQDVVVCQSAHD